MQIEIVTPEAVLFKGNVKWIRVPSVKGSFQILENHSPIIAVLEKGEIDISLLENVVPEAILRDKFNGDESEIHLNISGGTIEHKENKSMILVEL